MTRVRDIERTGGSDLDYFARNPIKENSMQLPTTKTSREGHDPRDARLLIAGPPKVGKTTLAAQWAPDTTLILDTHRGTKLLDGEHYTQPIATFPEFEQAIALLVAGGHKFRTVVIDLIEDIYKLADEHAANQYGKVAAGLVEYGKGTAHSEALFRQALSPLLATSLGVWFISHTDTIQDGNRITYIPKIDKRVRTLIEGACDFCLLAEATNGQRYLHTTPSGRYQAGSRVPLPEPMPLDARTLYVEIAKGLIKPKATTTSENTQDASTSPKEAVPA
jgi:hypothetical protein